MDCEGITTKIKKLQSNDTEIAGLFAVSPAERINEVFKEQNRIVLEVLASLGNYSAEIARRELLAFNSEYVYISSFSEGRAWGYKEDSTDLIDEEGNILSSFGYRSFTPYPFINGSAVVYYDTLHDDSRINIENSLINRQGEKIAGPFTGINRMRGTGTENILYFSKDNGKGDGGHTDVFVRRDGTEIPDVIPVTPFSENRAWIQAQDNSAQLILVDEDFKEIARRVGNYSTRMLCGRCWVNTGGTMYDLINYQGELVETFSLAQVNEFREGFSIIHTVDGDITFVNTEGEIVYGIYNGGAVFSEGLARVRRKEDDRYIFIGNTSGLPVLTNDLKGYNEASSFSEGYAVICESMNDYYFIDHSGKEQFGRHFDWASSFKDGVAKVLIDGKYFWIDHQGRRVF